MAKQKESQSAQKEPLDSEVVITAEENTFTPAQWIDQTVAQAFAVRASDIHIEPYQGELIVRYRVDGVLRVVDRQPLSIHQVVMSRLKVISQLNIAESHKPQEGHANIPHPAKGADEPLEVRVSIFPTVAGETAELRILNRDEFVFATIPELGMAHADAERFAEVITCAYGIVLVSGPVGVGKTTTLYTALKQLQAPDRNIMTLEDPVEFRLDFVRQSQVNPSYGYTYSTGLKSILRQDPDVIMVGEIRDSETAEIAVRASLLGKLIFSTLYTYDSVSAIVRLMEFGIPRSFIASSLHMVVSQRLVRKLCPHCIEEYRVPFKTLSAAGMLSDQNDVFRRGKGCAECFQSGYRGRTGVYEVLFVDDEIKEMILEDAPVSVVRSTAKARGMASLREEAIRKAREGVTTLEEALHATPG